MFAGPINEDLQFRQDLEEARRIAYTPIEHMNRAERRTKQGRKLQAECTKNLEEAVGKIMIQYGIDPNGAMAAW